VADWNTKPLLPKQVSALEVLMVDGDDGAEVSIFIECSDISLHGDILNLECNLLVANLDGPEDNRVPNWSLGA